EEDGIRARNVPGVQTCALPICMMLGDPEALVAQLPHLDRPLDRVPEGRGLRLTMAGARAVEQGEPHAVINARRSRELPGTGVEDLSSAEGPRGRAAG